jgi:hypothetical protein
MNARNTLITLISSFALTIVSFVPAMRASVPAPQAAGQSAIAKSIGTIKTINGNVLTLVPASGPEVSVTVQPNARILRLQPGSTDVKSATPLALQDLQVGDTIRARGPGSDDGKSINALEIIVITHSAVAAVSDQIRQDWQKRGIGGLVSEVDTATGTVTITITGFSGKKTIAVHTAKSTVIRRYAPDSIKFEDAKPSTLQEIQPGDQLRARGTRNADGTEFTAEEVVTGTFPFVVGTVKSVDASAGTLSVQDILSKKTVEVKVTAGSQLHKIPPEMAQRFAARLKGNLPPGTPGAGSAPAGSAAQGSTAPSAAGQTPTQNQAPPTGGQTAQGGGARSGGAPDFQQLLSRLPSSTLADLQLQKGDAVVILATQGTPTLAGTAITLLSGVEPILQAAPNAGQAMMLAPWSLGGAPGGDAGSQ